MFAYAASTNVLRVARPARVAAISLLTGTVIIGVLLDLVESRVERG